MSEFRDKEEQPDLVVPSAVNLNAEEEADEQASLVPPESEPESDPVAEVDATATSDGAAPPPAGKSKKASLGKSFSLVAILTVV